MPTTIPTTATTTTPTKLPTNSSEIEESDQPLEKLGPSGDMDQEWIPFTISNLSSSTSDSKELSPRSTNPSSTTISNSRTEKQENLANAFPDRTKPSENTPVLRTPQRGWYFETNRRLNKDKSIATVPIVLPRIDQECPPNVGTQRSTTENRPQRRVLSYTDSTGASKIFGNKNASGNSSLLLPPIRSQPSSTDIHKSTSSSSGLNEDETKDVLVHRRHNPSRKKIKRNLDTCPPRSTWFSSESEEVDSDTNQRNGISGFQNQHDNANDCNSESEKNKFIKETNKSTSNETSKTKGSSFDNRLSGARSNSLPTTPQPNKGSNSITSQSSRKCEGLDQESLEESSIGSSESDSEISNFKQSTRRSNNISSTTSSDDDNNGCLKSGVRSNNSIAGKNLGISRLVESRSNKKTHISNISFITIINVLQSMNHARQISNSLP